MTKREYDHNGNRMGIYPKDTGPTTSAEAGAELEWYCRSLQKVKKDKAADNTKARAEAKALAAVNRVAREATQVLAHAKLEAREVRRVSELAGLLRYLDQLLDDAEVSNRQRAKNDARLTRTSRKIIKLIEKDYNL